jgi:YD repeat-containing protein
MVAIITGKGAGLERSSGWILGSQGQLGSAALGRANDNVFVNAANGNLVITRQDEFLIGRGPDVSIDRTYNSQAVAGVTDGDNDDNWRMGVYRRVDGTSGAATIKRIDWDGSDTVYEMIGANLYRAKDGSGAHDKLAWSGTQWTWTDGDSQLTDVYDSTGKLLSSSDTDGNSLTYTYAAGLITKVTGADGEHSDLVYSGTQLQQITTYGTGPTPLLVRVRYAYDLADRLATVTVDLSPGDRSADDYNTYVTSYTYDEDSNRIASISQQDGSRVSFTYVEVGADYRIGSFSQTVETGITRTTGFDYSVAGRTTVTDPAGRNTTLFYDAAKNLTQISYPPEEAGATPKVVQFGYDGDGNLASATLGPGDVISYGYDGSGNLTSERDSAGNTITRTYGAKNDLITETKYLVPDPDGAGAGQPGTPLVTRYAYDPENHLRYAVSAEGVVIQHNYSAAGQRISSVEFAANTYTAAGAIDETLLNAWAAAIGDKSNTRRTETAYNFRGAVESVTSWSRLLPSGAFDTGSERSQTTYVYDQAGNLLTRQVTGSPGSEVFLYDGLNRTIMATDFNGAVTRTTFFDALGRTVIGHANGRNEISTYNRAGELIAFSQSNAGANLIALDGWPADPGNVPGGNASVPGWLNNPYYNDETQWAATEGPGGLQVVAMQAGQQDPGLEGGGAYTNAVTIDSSKAYEFIYYFQLDAVNVHSIYFGTNLATTGAYVEDASTGADAANPYFFSRGYGQQNIFTADKWYKVVGYVLAEGAALVPQGSLGGVYDVETGELVAATTGVYRWNAGRPDNQVYSRFFNFYNESAQGYSTYFYQPGIREVGAPIAATAETATTQYRYDNLGRLRMVVDPLGQATYMIYDAVGRKVADVDADGSVVEYRYDGSDRLSSTIRYATRLTAGELVSLADFDSGGDGSTATLGATGNSQLVNGGFDQSGDPTEISYGRSNTWLPGWSKLNPESFEQVAAGELGVTGTSGAYWLDLDSVAGSGAPMPVGPNLLTNGSFDTSGTYTALPHGRSNSSLPGWTKTNAENFEQVLSGQMGVTGTDGAYWLDLDSVAGSGYTPVGSNLLVNGSFDTSGTFTTTSTGRSNTTMPGWSKTNPETFEQVAAGQMGVLGTDGAYWLDLESVAGSGYQLVGSNLLTNGSFETSGSYTTISTGRSNTTLPGWSKSNSEAFEQVTSGQMGVTATNGTFWFDLDSVAAIGGVVATGPNLLVNGSFDISAASYTTPSTPPLGSPSWGRASSTLPGWVKTNQQGNFKQVTSGFYGVAATDGPYWLDLDGYSLVLGELPTNMDIRQTVSGLAAGATMLLQFDHANRTTAESGGFQVYWNNTLVATINTMGTTMLAESYQLTALAGDNVLRFLGTGRANQVGASLDNVRLYATTTAGGGGNMDISQTVGGLTAGQLLQLQFDHANRTTAASGSFEVYWNNTLIATVTDTGTTMLTKTYTVTAAAGNNTLRFKGIGTVDAVGASLDNVSLIAMQPVVNGGNMDISQTVAGLTAGQIMQLQFNHANRTGGPSGNFEVYWNGALAATVTDTSATMQTKTYQMAAIGGNNVLRFKSLGTVDAAGASLDDVRLFATQAVVGGGNMDFSQTVGGLAAGQIMQLKFDHANRTTGASGSFEVYWNGSLLDQINSTGATMQTKTYNVTAVAGNNSLRFMGTGTVDANGASIDNVRLFATQTDVGGGNMDVSQTVSGLAAGQVMRLRFNHANRTTAASGSFEVWWNGECVCTIADTGTAMQTKSYDVTAAAGNNTLRFKSLGTVDAAGASIDNIRLFSTEVVGGTGAGSLGVKLADVRPDASADDAWTWNVYDAAGRVIEAIDGTGATTAYAYDGASRLVSARSYANRLSASALAALKAAAPPTLTLPAADASSDRVARSFHDNDGRLIGTLDGEGFLTRIVYDKTGRKIESIAYAGATSAALRAAGTFAQLLASIAIDNARDIHNYCVYDARGLLRAEIDGEGDLTRYGYTPLGDVSQIVTGQKLDPAGLLTTPPTFANLPDAPPGTLLQTIAYTRNLYGQILTETTSLTGSTGTVTTYVYDAMRRLVSTTTQSGGPDPRTETRRYDTRGRLTGELSGIGSALLAALGPNPDAELVDPIWADHGISHSYDAADRLVATSDANGARTLFYYDVDGKLVYQVGAVGEVVEYRYNALGGRSDAILHAARLDPETLSEMVGGAAADVAGIVAALASSALDQASHVEFNVDGTIRQSTDALGEVTTYIYNAFGELVVQSDPLDVGTAIQTVFAYDRRGQVRMQAVDSASGGKMIVTLYGYDAFGRAVQLTDPNNHATATAFDRAGRVTSTTDALNNTTNFTYDARGNLVAVKDALNHVTRYVYDHAGRRIFAVDALGGVVETVYDDDDRVLATRAYADAVWTGGWGLEIAAGDVTAQLIPSSSDRVTRSAYDEDGRLRFTVDGVSGLTEYRYDDVGNAIRTIGYDWAVSPASTYTMEDLQAEVDAHAADPMRVTRAVYDATARLTFSLDATANVTAFTYDSAGRIIRQIALATVYEGGDDPLYDVMRDWASINTDADDRIGRAVYDRKGRLVYSIDAEGFVTEYRYNKLDGVVKEIRYTAPYAIADGATAAGVAAQIGSLPASAIVTDFVYDSAGRLTETVDGLGHRTVMALDQRGQILSATLAYGTGDAVTTTRSYDALGRLTSESRADGTAEEQTTSYGYNALGDLVSITRAVGTSAESATMRKYDGLGRLRGELPGIGSAMVAALGPNPDDELVDPIWAEYGTLFGYDTAGRLIARSDANGARTLYYYDTADRLVYQVDAVGGVVEYRYNRLGDRTETIRYAARIDSGTLSEMAGGRAADAAATVAALADSSLDEKMAATYDAAGRLALNADQLGGYTAYAYNSFGEVRLSKAALGESGTPGVATEIETSFAYDRRGSLKTEIVDSALGGKAITTGHDYDAFGREIALTDPNNHATATGYDRAGRIVSTTDALNNTTFFTYDARGNLVAVKDALNHVTRYVYDHADRLIFTVDAIGDVIETSYDGDGRVSATRAYADAISPAGFGLQITAANVTERLSADADDRITRNAYDKDGRLRFAVDGVSGLTEYRYDDVGNAIRTIHYGWTVSPASTYTMEDLQAQIDAHAADPMRITRAVHDAAGRVTFAIDATGKVIAFTYDSAGRLIKQIVLATAYQTDDDPLNDVMRDWAATNPHADDRVGRAVYDREGRLAYSIDAEGFVTEYRHNRQGDVILQIRYADPYAVADGATPASLAALLPSTVPESAVTTDYFYDSAGRLEKTRDALDNWTMMSLDQRGQIVSTILAWGTSDATTTTRGYDALGRLETETRADGAAEESATIYDYNAIGELETITYAAGTADECVTTRTYDAAGRLATETRATGADEEVTTVYDHNAFGDVESTTAAAGTVDEQVTTRVYDALGRVESETVADGSAAEATTAYAYNAFGNVARITDPRLNSAYFYYDNRDRLILQVDPEGYATSTEYGLGDGPLAVTRYANRTQGATITAPPTIILDIDEDAATTFHYDKLDRLTDITDAEEHSEHYELDAQGNRTEVVNKLGGVTDNVYDLLGRLKTQIVHANVHDWSGTLVATAIQTDFDYDKRGNLKTQTQGIGLGADQRVTSYAYDKLDRLIEIDRPDIVSVTVSPFMDPLTVAMKDSFTYDRRGNVIASQVAGAPKTYTYYDELNRKTDEIDQSGMLSHWDYDANGNVKAHKVYGDAAAFAGARPAAPPGPVNASNFRETHYTYDKANRLETSFGASLTTARWDGDSYDFATGTIVAHIEYDAAGNAIRDYVGDVETRTFYDKLGRKIAQLDPEHYLTVWELDAEGNVLVETRHATRVTGSIAQNASIAALHAAAGSSGDDRITVFTYDLNGQRETETRLEVAASTTVAGELATTLHVASQILYEYNGFGQVTRRVEANSDETLLTYDGFGRLTKTRAPGFLNQLGASVRPTTDNLFDAYGNVVRTTLNDPSGPAADARVTFYVYNRMGWLASVTQQIDATLSTSHSYTYDAGGRIVWDQYSRRKSNGSNSPDSIVYTYDVSGRLLSQTVATRTTTPPAVPKWSSGDVTRFKYNVHGEMIGRGINYGADNLPLYQETFDYDEGGRLWRSTEGGSGKIMFYDAPGNATLTLSSAGANVGALSFAAAKSSIEAAGGSGDTNITDAVTTIGVFDKRGQHIASIEPDRQLASAAGTVTIASSRTLNAFGETTTETDARNNTTNLFYSTMGRLIRKESPQVSWTDQNGTQANVHPTEHYFYDVSGRLIAITDASDRTTRRNLLAGTGHDGADALVTVEYHADNRKVQTLYDVFHDARISRNEYWIDNSPNNDPAKTDVLMAYDKLGRLIEVQHLGRLLTETFTYDQLGQRTGHAMNTLTETTDYDRQGRVIKQVAFGGDQTTYSYIWNGLLTTGTLNLGGWLKTTINAATVDATETLDYFNRTLARSDFGGNAYAHAYDWGGRMTSLAGPGETLTYAYLNTGRLASISNGAGNSTAFGYDKAGNETSEVTYKGGQLIQNSTATWDSLGRMSSWAETGTATLPAASIQYEYDRVGNIRRQKSTFQRLDGAGNPMGLLPTQDNWYLYDVMDRVTRDRGTLVAMVGSELKTGDDARGIGTVQRQQPGVLTSLNRLGEIGYDYEYDESGRRMSMAMSKVRYEGGFPQNAFFREHKEMYDYFADGSLKQIRWVDGAETGFANFATISVPSASGTGILLSEFTRDAFGRTTSQTDWVTTNVRGFSRTGITYNDKGQITEEWVTNLTTENNQNVLYVNHIENNNYGTGEAYALGAVVGSTSTVTRNGGAHSTATTTNTYDWRDAPVITKAQIYTTRQQGGITDYVTNYHYGASNELVSVDIHDGRPRTVSFINDMAGQVIRRDETGGTSSGAPHEIWYRFGGKQMGEISNNGTLDNDYQQSLLYRQVWLGDSENLGAFRLGGNTPKTYADFSQSLTPINSYEQGGAGGAYIVRAGDTLQSVAATLWGNADLWYKLAEANGLSGGSMLTEGSSLTIPPGVVSNAHNDGTFRPYDAAKALGDLSPSAQKPPAKPGGCGMLGQLIVMAIAIAITLIIKVPVAQMITAALKTAVGVGTALVGAVGAVAGAVVTGAAASAVSQGIGVATGLTDKFSWKGVALAGLSAGLTQGFAEAAGSIATSATKAATLANAPVSTAGRIASYVAGSSIGGQIVRGVIIDTAYQGIAVATGLQKKFDWAGIAANAAATGIGALAGQGLVRLGADAAFAGAVSNLAGGVASAGTRSLLTGTSFGDNIAAVLPGVLANTIGNLIAGALAAGRSAAPAAETDAAPDITLDQRQIADKARATLLAEADLTDDQRRMLPDLPAAPIRVAEEPLFMADGTTPVNGLYDGREIVVDPQAWENARRTPEGAARLFGLILEEQSAAFAQAIGYEFQHQGRTLDTGALFGGAALYSTTEAMRSEQHNNLSFSLNGENFSTRYTDLVDALDYGFTVDRIQANLHDGNVSYDGTAWSSGTTLPPWRMPRLSAVQAAAAAGRRRGFIGGVVGGIIGGVIVGKMEADAGVAAFADRHAAVMEYFYLNNDNMTSRAAASAYIWTYDAANSDHPRNHVAAAEAAMWFAIQNPQGWQNYVMRSEPIASEIVGRLMRDAVANPDNRRALSSVSPALNTYSRRIRNILIIANATRGLQHWEAHHIIPVAEVYRLPRNVQAAMARAGWRVDSLENLIALPADPVTYRSAPNLTTLPYHQGSHPHYSLDVRARLLAVLPMRDIRRVLGTIEGTMTRRLLDKSVGYHQRVH